MVKVGRSKSNQSVDSLPKDFHRCKSVRMFASQEKVPTEENGQVLIHFDRRNTEFLNKVRVSTASGELRKLLLAAIFFDKAASSCCCVEGGTAGRQLVY